MTGAAASLSAASVHEAAGQVGALPSRIRPLAATMRVRGPAYPVRCPAGDNLWLHRAIVAAPCGAVLVVAVDPAPPLTGEHADFGYWGEIMDHAAMARNLAGLVIDGSIRDSDTLARLGFPVFSRGPCIRGTSKDPGRDGALAKIIKIGDVRVEPGDLVLGDADGVVVISADTAGRVIDAACRRDLDEKRIIDRLSAGESTLDIFGWTG